jgi:hypothetical protein
MSDTSTAGSPSDTAPKSPSPGDITTQTAPDATTTTDAGKWSAPKTAGSVMADPGDKAAAAPANFPDNWRDLLADGDKNLAKEFERYTDPKALAKSWREQKATISKGLPKASLPENATPEQLAEWRQANGIPESPDKYEVKLPNGMVIGEQDRPLVDKFLGRMHAKNTPPELVNEALSTYYEMQEDQAAQMAEAVKASRVEAEEALRADWGPEFRSNVNAGTSLLVGTFGEEMANAIMAATDEYGIPLGNKAAFLKGVAALAKEANPAAGVLPAGTDGSLGSLEAEKAKLDKRMREDRAGWYKDGAAQERYQKIVDAIAKNKGRAA